MAQPRHLSDLCEPPAALPVTVDFAGQLVTMAVDHLGPCIFLYVPSPRAELLQATTQQD